MDSFDSIVAELRKKKGVSIGFAAAEGKNKPIIVKGDKKKSGESLKGKFGAGETPIAWGSVKINDDGMCEFTCVNAKPGFKKQTLKPFFSKIKEKPVIQMQSDVDDGLPWAENPLYEEGDVAWTENPLYEEPELEPGDETLNVLWQRSFGGDLQKLGVPQERLDTVRGIMEPVQCKLPGIFMRTLQNHNAAPFAQKIVDAINAKYKKALPLMKKQFPDDPTLQGVRANEIMETFGRDVEQIIETSWDAFVTRYDVAKKMKKKRFKAVALPTLGAVAAIGGIATSGGNPVSLIPAVIAGVRAVISLADAFRVYGRNLEVAVKSLSKSGDRLKADFDKAKVAWKDVAGETGRASLNALATGGFGQTLSSVSSDATALEGRRSDTEIGLDKLFGRLEDVIGKTTKLDAEIRAFEARPIEEKTDKLVRQMGKLKDEIDKLGTHLTDNLENIATENPKLDKMKVDIAKVAKIVEGLQAAKDNPVNSLAKYEQIMSLFTTAAVGVAGLGAGIATWSAEGGSFVVIGAIADTLDEINSVLDG